MAPFIPLILGVSVNASPLGPVTGESAEDVDTILAIPRCILSPLCLRIFFILCFDFQ